MSTCIAVKLYFPAMPLPIHVMLPLETLRVLNANVCHHQLPDGLQIFSRPDNPSACLAFQITDLAFDDPGEIRDGFHTMCVR